MFIATLSMRGPMMKKIEIARMVRSLPYLLHAGPEIKAPKKPPMVKSEVMAANWAGVIWMHCGRLALVAVAATLSFSQVMTF